MQPPGVSAVEPGTEQTATSGKQTSLLHAMCQVSGGEINPGKLFFEFDVAAVSGPGSALHSADLLSSQC